MAVSPLFAVFLCLELIRQIRYAKKNIELRNWLRIKFHEVKQTDSAMADSVFLE